MKCRRCDRNSEALYCDSCRLQIIEKKIRKQGRGMFKKGDKVLADQASAYYASQIPYIEVVSHGKYNKKLVPATIDTALHEYLGVMFSGKLPKYRPEFSLFASITNEELAFAAKQRGLKVPIKGQKMLDRLEHEYPGVKNSFFKCLKQLGP